MLGRLENLEIELELDAGHEITEFKLQCWQRVQIEDIYSILQRKKHKNL